MYQDIRLHLHSNVMAPVTSLYCGNKVSNSPNVPGLGHVFSSVPRLHTERAVFAQVFNEHNCYGASPCMIDNNAICSDASACLVSHEAWLRVKHHAFTMLDQILASMSVQTQNTQKTAQSPFKSATTQILQ